MMMPLKTVRDTRSFTALLLIALLSLAGEATAQEKKAGEALEQVKISDLPTGDFGMDDVEELPLPTEEEGGVQIDGKDYMPKPKAVAKPQPPAPAPVEPAAPAPAVPATEPAAPTVAQPPVTPVTPEAPAAPAAPEAAPSAPPSETPALAAPDTQSVPELPATPEEQAAPADNAAPATVASETTPSAPPQVVPGRLGAEGGPDVYTIEKGDNLWDICQRMFGDPFLWPRLWAMNQYITNPHLIYPGDQLRFYMGTATSAPKMEVTNAAGEQLKVDQTGQTTGEDLAKAQGTLEAPVVPQTEEKLAVETREQLKTTDLPGKKPDVEVMNYAFVTDQELTSAGYISHSGEEKTMLTTGDTVYMKFDDMASVREGDEFLIMERIGPVRDPRKKSRKLGSLVHYKGRIRVQKTGEQVITGVIEDSWWTSTREDRVVANKSLIRRVTPKVSEKKIVGQVIESSTQQYMIGQNTIAFVNVGKAQGIEDGDELVVVRQGDGVYGQKEGLPDVVFGNLTVIEAMDNFAIVQVNWSKNPIEIGDRVTTRL